MNWYLEALKKYAVFSGRARRKEFWFFCLFDAIIVMVLGIIQDAVAASLGTELSILTGIYGLATVLPRLAVTVRRLHDTNHSGWWLLIAVVPVIGAIVLLVWMLRGSEHGDNRFGSNPKPAAEAGAAHKDEKKLVESLGMSAKFNYQGDGKNIVFGRGSSITDEELAALIPLNLEELYLSRTQLTDKSIAHFEAMEQLQVLDVSHTCLTQDGINRLKKLRSGMKVHA